MNFLYELQVVIRSLSDVHRDTRFLIGKFHTSNLEQRNEISLNIYVLFRSGMLPHHVFPFAIAVCAMNVSTAKSTTAIVFSFIIRV